jgi:hypothetical protein
MIGKAYKRRSDHKRRIEVDDDTPDIELAKEIVWSLVDGEVDPASDMDYGIYAPGGGGDPEFEALTALPLPKWARISDTRNRGGRLLLVLPPRHWMSDLKYYLEHRRDSYRVTQLRRGGGLRRILERALSRKKRGASRGRKAQRR